MVAFRNFTSKPNQRIEFSAVSIFFLFGATPPQWARASSFTRLLDLAQRRTTVVRTPLDEWSARRRDLYLTTHNTHNRQTSMPPVGFESTISAGERPQTYALELAATGTGHLSILLLLNVMKMQRILLHGQNNFVSLVGESIGQLVYWWGLRLSLVWVSFDVVFSISR